MVGNVSHLPVLLYVSLASVLKSCSCFLFQTEDSRHKALTVHSSFTTASSNPGSQSGVSSGMQSSFLSTVSKYSGVSTPRTSSQPVSTSYFPLPSTTTLRSPDINIPLFFILYFGWKIFKRTKIWKPIEMDFVTVRLFFSFFQNSCSSNSRSRPIQGYPLARGDRDPRKATKERLGEDRPHPLLVS